MPKAKIKKEVCKGCGLCVVNCPKKILKLTEREINAMGYNYCQVSDPEACIGCAMCATICPDCAIDVD